ncbi:MAG TPA: PLP-dependent aminotransferase family protein, partial [Aggregatilineales bacterium]|nr:PLP-dependent aminotransferase family protein [Aggregatilineales bacterium]
ERIFTKNPVQALQYGPTEGYEPLREIIAEQYRARGVPATVDNVLITAGSQQGLDLVGRTLINEADPVVTETPTYVGALQAWRALAPHFVGVPMDECGMLTDQLGKLDPFKLTYLLPNFQNPSGISLSAERRIKALELAQQNHFLIVEDDPYRELRYSGQDVPALVESEAAMLGSNWNTGTKVVHLGSFSKTLSPGLRLGWMLASEHMIHMCVLAKQGTDLHSSALSQMITEDLLRHHTLEKNIPKIRTLYRERRDTMLDVLGSRLTGHAQWTRPDGGLFLWMTIPGESDSPGLLEQALKQNVAFVPGDAFYFDGRGKDALRLNFSVTPPDMIREGINRLSDVILERQIHPAGVR